MSIKIFESFSGYGSQFEAAKRVFGDEVRSVGIMEIDSDAIISYALIHHKGEFDLLYNSFSNNLEKQDIELMRKELKAINVAFNFKAGKSKIDSMKKDKLLKLYVACKVSNNYGDISLANSKKLDEEIDLYTYSFPCQDISVSGKLGGVKEGTRSGLLWECEKFIELNRPRILLMENVKNLIGKTFINDFQKWVNKLEELGYKNYFQVLNSKNYGIPQNRERVFMLSFLEDNGYEFPEPMELTTKLKDILEKTVDEKYYLKGEAVEKLITQAIERYDIMNDNKKIIIDDTLGFDLEARMYEKYSPTLRAGRSGLKTLEAKIEMLGMLDIKGNECIRRVYGTEGISPTLTTMQGGNRQPKIMLETPCVVASRGRNPENPTSRTSGLHTEQRLEANLNGTSNTLTTVQKDNYVLDGIDQFKIRKLSPLECWKLMGMNEESYKKVAEHCSDSAIYKMAGNSIVVNTLEAIIKNIKFS